MTRPQHLLYTAAEAEAEEGDTDNDDLAQNPVVASETSKAELTKSSTADDDNDSRKSSISTNSRRASPGSGEGYTADCSSDASSDPSSELSGSAKKHSKDNMILASVTKLSIKENEDDDQSNEDSAEGGTKEKSVHNHANNNKKKKKRRKRTAHHSHSRSHTKHKNHHTNQDRSGSSGSGSDMADVEDGNVPAQAVQWNGVKVVHPMDPRIDISKVGYIYQSPVSTGPSSSDDASGGGSGTGNGSCPQSQHQEETPSMEHYMQLMEVVRPFFSSHGICTSPQPTVPGQELQPSEESLIQPPQQASFSQPQSLQQEQQLNNADHAQHNQSVAGDSRNSASLTASQGASSQSSESENPHQRHKDAPLHMQAKHPLPRNLDNRERHADAPLQLEARRRPLQAAAAADFYAPDDPDDNDNSDTSSMVVLARAKRKHKLNSSSDASETTSQKEQSSLIDRESHKQATASNKSKNEGNGMDAANGRDSNVRMDDAEEDDRKPPAQPLAHVAQAVRQENNDDDSNDQDQEEQAQGNSSSSSEQCVAPGARAQHQPIHAYDLPHIVTESGSNNNTTSGSGSGGNSGSNQGSSGSGNGSSGNGSSGSGNEAKNISEEAGAKEETSPDTNSNSEDINSGDQKPDDRMEIANPVTARRGQGTADADHAMKQDPASLPTNANSDHNPAEEAIKERKRFEKKRKRLNMRREYEEKVQQELESSESSVSYGAVNLRPGKPITLDKVLSFSKIARVVIQAGPPFLLVHTNAAYTRLTGIDAHAAVGKPVSALLSVLGPGNTLSSSAINADLEGNEGDVNQISSSSNGAGNSNGAVSLNEVTSQDQTNSYLEGRTAPPRQRMEGWNMESSGANQPNGQTYAQAAAAGVARAAQASQNESADVRLERLIATAGFGKYHRLHATCRPHHMVGRNVSFVNRAGGSGASIPLPGMQNDYGSSDMSLTSKYEGPFDMVVCRASISPIVLDYIETGVVTDTNNQDFHEHNNKRRKHHHTGHDQQKPGAGPNIGHHHRRSFANKVDSAALKRYHQHLTHYAIQLEIFDDRKELNRDLLSSSSTSVEANILGLTKGEYRRQREVAQGGTGANTATSREGSEARQHLDEDDDMASETTEATAPVTAVG